MIIIWHINNNYLIYNIYYFGVKAIEDIFFRLSNLLGLFSFVYWGDLDDGKSKAHRWPAKGFPKLLASLCGLSWHARIIKCCQDSRLLSTRPAPAPAPHIHMCPGTFRLHLLPQGQGERTGFNLYEAYFISFFNLFYTKKGCFFPSTMKIKQQDLWSKQQAKWASQIL